MVAHYLSQHLKLQRLETDFFHPQSKALVHDLLGSERSQGYDPNEVFISWLLSVSCHFKDDLRSFFAVHYWHSEIHDYKPVSAQFTLAWLVKQLFEHVHPLLAVLGDCYLNSEMLEQQVAHRYNVKSCVVNNQDFSDASAVVLDRLTLHRNRLLCLGRWLVNSEDELGFFIQGNVAHRRIVSVVNYLVHFLRPSLYVVNI